MDILKASDYHKGLKYNLIAKNNYDTVAGKVMLNADSSDTQVATNNISITRDWTSAFTRQAYQKNNTKAGAYWYDLAYSNVAVRMVSQTIQFRNLSTPIASNAYVKLTFGGTTYKIPRGSNFELTDIANIYGDAEEVSSFIQNNAHVESSSWSGSSSTSVDYNENKLNMFAWIRKAYLTGSQDINDIVLDGSDEYENNKPPVADIMTTWAGGEQGINGFRCCANSSNAGNWYYNDNKIMFPATYPNPIVEQSPESGPQSYPLKSAMRESVAYSEVYEYITISIAKIDDYNFDVTITYPEKYQYIAASRYIKLGLFDIVTDKPHLDSYAFIDFIETVNVELYGTVYDENTEEFAYSLDDNKNIIDGKNKNILKLSNNELITKGTNWTDTTEFMDTSWTTQVTKLILTRYAKGMSTIELTVPADFAIANDISINTPFFIKDVNNKLIERGYRIAAFEVKNITKKFRNSEYVWTLKLLENKLLSQPDLKGIEMIYYSDYVMSKINLLNSYSYPTSNGYSINEEHREATNDIPWTDGMLIRLPQITSEDITCEKGMLMLPGLNDLDLDKISLVVVFKLPFWETWFWWAQYGSATTINKLLKTHFFLHLSYTKRDATSEYTRLIASTTQGNTLNAQLVYHVAVLEVTRNDLITGVIPLLEGFEDNLHNKFLAGSSAQFQCYIAKAKTLTAQEAFTYMINNNILDNYIDEPYDLPTARSINTTHAYYVSGTYYRDVDCTQLQIADDEYPIACTSISPSGITVSSINYDNKIITLQGDVQASSVALTILFLKKGGN